MAEDGKMPGVAERGNCTLYRDPSTMLAFRNHILRLTADGRPTLSLRGLVQISKYESVDGIGVYVCRETPGVTQILASRLKLPRSRSYQSSYSVQTDQILEPTEVKALVICDLFNLTHTFPRYRDFEPVIRSTQWELEDIDGVDTWPFHKLFTPDLKDDWGPWNIIMRPTDGDIKRILTVLQSLDPYKVRERQRGRLGKLRQI